MLKAGIYGATGYTGFELAKILQRHPQVEIAFATSESNAGVSLRDVFPAAPHVRLITAADADPSATDVVFLCLPHGAAAQTAIAALAAGARVIDLSADFRLKDAAAYEHWYGAPHPEAGLLAEAVYGLTEFARADLPGARLVANPGCYPTSVLLAVQPAVAAGAAVGTMIADSKSGVSGAGRVPRQHTHFVEVADNFTPYKIGRAHRHLPEMEQQIRQWSDAPPGLLFSPHLLPVPRGILSTVYIPLAAGWNASAVYDLYRETYAHEPFVRVLPVGELATLAHANHTNLCALGLTLVDDLLIITSALDNLIKGAAGQAVQNMNVVFGLEETEGLG